MTTTNEKYYNFVKREKEENVEFIDLITTAIDKLGQARSNISYSSFPTVNKGMIGDLEVIIDALSRIEYNVTNGHIQLLKIAKKEKPNYYYKLDYFFNRKNSGSWYIVSKLNLKDYNDHDSFLIDLAKEGTISEEIMAVTSISKISKEQYELNK